MNEPDDPLWLDKPQLTDEAAAQLVNFLQELLVAVENAFYVELNRYYARRSRGPSPYLPRSNEPSDPDTDPF